MKVEKHYIDQKKALRTKNEWNLQETNLKKKIIFKDKNIFNYKIKL